MNNDDVWGWMNQPMAAPSGGGSIQPSQASMPMVQQAQPGFISSTVAPLAATKALDKASTVGYGKLAGLFSSSAPAAANYAVGTGELAAAAPLVAPAYGAEVASGILGGSTAAGALAAPVAETAAITGMAAPAAAAVGGEAAAAPMLAAMGPLGWAALGIMGTRALGLWS